MLNPICFLSINLLTDSRCAARHKTHFFNILARIEFEVLFFDQNYEIYNIINTINHQNINIVTALSYNI